MGHSEIFFSESGIAVPVKSDVFPKCYISFPSRTKWIAATARVHSGRGSHCQYRNHVSDFFGGAIVAGSVTLHFRFWCVSKMQHGLRSCGSLLGRPIHDGNMRAKALKRTADLRLVNPGPHGALLHFAGFGSDVL